MIYLQVHYHFSGKFGIIYTLPCIILFPITAPVIRWVSKCACQSIKLRDSVLLRGDNFRCKWKVRARMFLVILNLLWKIYNMHFHTWRLYPPLLNTFEISIFMTNEWTRISFRYHIVRLLDSFFFDVTTKYIKF